MDTDEFLAKGLDGSGSDESDVEEQNNEEDEDEDENEEETANSDTTSTKKNSSKHKMSLDKLQKSDPDFYEFLKNEDKELLNFEESESDSSDDDADTGKPDGPRVHKLPQKLEVASDEETDEEDLDQGPDPVKEKANTKKSRQVNLKLISHWSAKLKTTGSLKVAHEVVIAFRAAVRQAASPEDDDAPGKYNVEGSACFNAIVRLCITELLPVWTRVLKIAKPKEGKSAALPSSSDKWKAIRSDVKSYLTDLLTLLTEMSEPAILTVLLKHINQMVFYFASFHKMAKVLIRKLIKIWSSGEETNRVLAFLSINKLTIKMQATMLDFTMKHMYMSYVKNCKFTSPTTLPLINFMQRSLVEVCAIDAQLTYQYAFIYIRQLAIHLRNAITIRKAETLSAVYNWQYIHSLCLWSRLLSNTHPSPALQPLIYPLVQTIIGAIKLESTARYYPLRLHCVRALNMIAGSTGTFIPVLPFLLDIFQMTDFNKKHTSLNFKPFNFAVILKLSQGQLKEKGFRDGLQEQLFEHLLETLNVYAKHISFPELSLTAILQLKDFHKKCKVANYTRQMKTILDKIIETNKFIELRRRGASLDLSDKTGIAAWETLMVADGTPISTYFAKWRKMRDREIQQDIAGKERISSEVLPTIERNKGPRVATEEDRKEFADLFDSDEEEDDKDETRFLMKDERPRKKLKKNEKEDKEEKDESDDSADYSDFDDDDLEQLAKSADEDDEDVEEDDDEDDEDDDDDDEEDMEAEDDSELMKKKDVVEDFHLSDSD